MSTDGEFFSSGYQGRAAVNGSYGPCVQLLDQLMSHLIGLLWLYHQVPLPTKKDTVPHAIVFINADNPVPQISHQYKPEIPLYFCPFSSSQSGVF
jgi:hypothetical protein